MFNVLYYRKDISFRRYIHYLRTLVFIETFISSAKKTSSESKSYPHKNIPLTVAQHFPERRRTLSRMYKNILLTAAQDFMAQYRLFCKHTTHKNTIELFSNIETCFTIFLPFVVHSLIIIFYKGLNFVYFPV